MSYPDFCPCPAAVRGEICDEENQPDTASESYLQALKHSKFCDVVFTFENCEERIEAHQFVLRMRSPVFVAILRGQGSNVGNMREVKINGTSHLIFREFLEFMYADKFEVNITGALDLLHLGHKYKVRPLIKKCEALLKTEVKVKDAVQVFETARKYQHADLEMKAGYIMAQSLAEISQNEDFLNVHEDTLVYLLQRDDLTVDEVDLFTLVIKWGKNKLEGDAGPYQLKRVLAKVLPHVRFTNMTPNQFTTTVVPLNLLSAQEIISVYAYLATEEGNRQTAIAVPQFRTTPRQARNTEELVEFYEAAFASKATQIGRFPLKECISFSPRQGILEDTAKMWSNYPRRRPSVTGILIHFPVRKIRNSSLDDGTIHLKLSIKRSAGVINDHSLVQKFETFLTACREDPQNEIVVKPSVELIDGDNYCITVEDDSVHYQNRRPYHNHVEYKYSQVDAGSGIFNQTLIAPFKTAPLELTAVERNTNLTDFSDSSYRKICVIQGMRISLV